MSFKNQSNKHDCWNRFIEQHSRLVGKAGLPTEVLDNQSGFERFLTTGSCDYCEASLDQLSDDQFLVLETVVNAFFHDGWHQRELTEFSKQRYLRFKRYA